LFFLFRAAPVAYGTFQGRGRIGAAAASLCHRCSPKKEKQKKLLLKLNAKAKPTPQCKMSIKNCKREDNTKF